VALALCRHEPATRAFPDVDVELAVQELAGNLDLILTGHLGLMHCSAALGATMRQHGLVDLIAILPGGQRRRQLYEALCRAVHRHRCNAPGVNSCRSVPRGEGAPRNRVFRVAAEGANLRGYPPLAVSRRFGWNV